MNSSCPYCKGPLKIGYIQSSHQIYFNEGRKRIFASGDLKSKCISSPGVLKAPGVKAAYCINCKKIILDLE